MATLFLIARMHQIIVVIAALLAFSTAHVSMMYPCPRYNLAHGKSCPDLPPKQEIDYTPTSPISTSSQILMPLCRHPVPFSTPSAVWQAGQQITVEFNPGAPHGGGHCQFSLSYDGGKTFVVIHEELKYCFGGDETSGPNPGSVYQYTFQLPPNVPSSDTAIFAWTWVNAIGNREFYMNCADVSIQGSTSTSFTGKEMTIANRPGFPKIDSLNEKRTTGLEIYESAKQITVIANGSTSNSADRTGRNAETKKKSISNDQANGETSTLPSSPATQTDESSVITAGSINEADIIRSFRNYKPCEKKKRRRRNIRPSNNGGQGKSIKLFAFKSSS